MTLIKPHPISSTDAVTQSWGLDRAWTKTSSAHSSPVVFPPCSITSGDLWPPAGALKQGRGSTLPVKNARVVHRTVFIVGCLPLLEDGRNKTSWMSVNAANQLLISVYLRPSTHTLEKHLFGSTWQVKKHNNFQRRRNAGAFSSWQPAVTAAHMPGAKLSDTPLIIAPWWGRSAAWAWVKKKHSYCSHDACVVKLSRLQSSSHVLLAGLQQHPMKDGDLRRDFADSPTPNRFESVS